jgi:hypothetical protein
MSGHSEDLAREPGVVENSGFIQKPFAPSLLTQLLRQVLDQWAEKAGR